ncbi:hypothetical protein BDN71DRAFT_1404486, partial [Pleurotus eryngii]
IKDRLAMVHMQHHLDNPYTITEIYMEASFILGAATSASLDAILDNKDIIECILDTGFQITAMQCDVFDNLRLAIGIDKFITMESMNLSSNQTIGLAHNIKMSLSPINLYIQAQIINDTPYEVLLGCPFFCLTSTLTCDYPDGQQDLTIHDLNSGQQFLIPTFK